MTTLNREEFYSIVGNLNEKISDYWAHAKELDRQREERERERESAWEKQLEALNRLYEERDKRLILIAEGAEKAAQTAGKAAERANEAAERSNSLNRNFWLSTVTGAVTTIVSVFAIAIGSYFATQQSNESIVQTTLAAFQQGQNLSQLKSAK